MWSSLRECCYLKTRSRLICCDVEHNSFYPGITHRGYTFTEVRSTASVSNVPVSCHEFMHNWATGDKWDRNENLAASKDFFANLQTNLMRKVMSFMFKCKEF